jgi:alpha-beta hydrolase superfamily lysophospholipase
MLRETACKLDDRLAGIVTAAAAPASRRALVLVNAGVVPKHGPFRLYAELARRVADDGYTTLRFDLGGLGDSTADTSGAPLVARTAAEIRAAVDHVATTGRHDRVVVGGLCSGAEDAFRYAETDARVTGVVLVDPFAYRTPGWYPRDFVRRATGRVLRALGAWQPLAPGGRRLVDYRYMARREATRILAALVTRRARVHFVYTGGSARAFNHAGQLAAMFRGVDLDDRVTVDHLPDIEHTQLLAEDRARLVGAIGARLAAW